MTFPGVFPHTLFHPGAELIQVLSATSTASTITQPTGILAGDVLMLWDFASNAASLPTAVVPANYTQLIDSAGTVGRGIMSAKIANGTEGGVAITGMNGNATNSKLMYVFRSTGVAFKSAFTADRNSEIVDGNPAAQVVNASTLPFPLVVLAAYNVLSGVIDPRSFTPAKDGEINTGGTNRYLAYKIYNNAPEDTTLDQEDEGNQNCLASTDVMPSLVSQVSFVTSLVQQGEFITIPTVVSPGDIIVLADDAVGPGNSAVTPSGFTLLQNVVSGNTRIVISAKIADLADKGRALTGMIGEDAVAKSLLIFRANEPIRAFRQTTDSASTVSEADPGDVVLNFFNFSLSPAIALGFYSTVNGLVSPRSFTPTKDGEINSPDTFGLTDLDSWLAWKIYNTSPQVTTLALTDEGANNALIGIGLLVA